MSPQRIQRKRTKGWRVPLCSCGCGKPARYVGRPGKWGNPFAAKTQRGEAGLSSMAREILAADFRRWITEPLFYGWPDSVNAGGCADHLGVPYKGRPSPESVLSELRGHDLMCWCPLDQPCHADVLLELANPEDPR